jgi:hypothetical protein
MMQVTVDISARVIVNIRELADDKLLVGIPAEENARGEEIGNAALGFIHENGSPARNIPARPFLVPGMRDAEPQAVAMLEKPTADALTKGKDALKRGYERAGLVCQAAVKKRIVSQEGFAPLSPRTIAARQRKGYKGTKALIRTGQLLNSITYVVRKAA